MVVTNIQARAIEEPGGRQYAVLEISTDSGVSGFGEAPAAPDPRTAVDRLKRELQPLLGANPERAVRVDRDLERSGASPASRGAANIAILDILGRSAKSPLYEVLGGPTRTKARAMAVLEGKSTDDFRKAVLAAKSAGHRAFSIPLQVPETMERGRVFYTDIRDMLDELRRAAGQDCDFVLDCGGRISPGEATSIAARVESFHLLWLDEPTGDLNAAAQATISKGTVTPVGFGRHFTENSRFQDLLREDGIDVLRPDIALNGVTAIRKAAALAETYYVAVAPYHRGGPIGTAAGVHISASLPNSFIQETPFSMNEADRKARSAIAGGWDEKPAEGFFRLLEKPGLGIEVNRAALEAHTVAA